MACGGPADLVVRFLRTAANELGAAVNDHLWSVNAAAVNDSCVIFLAVREIGRGERVAPALAVPVINVFFEGDHFDTVEGLGAAKTREIGIGGRATGAAFGGEELDDNRLTGGSGIGGGPGRMAGPIGEGGGEEEG